MNGIVISRALHDRLLAAAAASPDAEVCGLLFGTGDAIEEAVPARNVAADPAWTFEVDPAALIAAHRAERNGGPRLIGHYHSHPSGKAEPSASDRDAAHSGPFWLIIGGGEVRAWRFVVGNFVEVNLIFARLVPY